MTVYHKELAAGRWFELSLPEQMANIGSEVHRAIMWHRKNDECFQNAFERALELFDLTLDDSRWKGKFKEICISREVFCSLMIEGGNYDNLDKELTSIDNYFTQFAYLVRNSK
ncbi:MAG: hypothetical protein ABI543_06105 [Ignavibacteria bacterium]